MSRVQLYDTIGTTYTATRRTEPRIAEQVWAALGDARTVLNVGAGTGSYEPPDRKVTAVEPSAVMRAQRPTGAAPCVAASAESLPFEDKSFDAAMAFATVHHWQDPIAGLLEMRRVARRVLVPWDCVDGFFEAYWRRPEAYLDESVRRGVSVWASVGPEVEERAVRSLREDLASGRWAERNRELLDLEAAELGLRLLIA
jgi:SAM-dependent methyltransferase